MIDKVIGYKLMVFRDAIGDSGQDSAQFDVREPAHCKINYFSKLKTLLRHYKLLSLYVH